MDRYSTEHSGHAPTRSGHFGREVATVPQAASTQTNMSEERPVFFRKALKVVSSKALAEAVSDMDRTCGSNKVKRTARARAIGVRQAAMTESNTTTIKSTENGVNLEIPNPTPSTPTTTVNSQKTRHRLRPDRQILVGQEFYAKTLL